MKQKSQYQLEVDSRFDEAKQIIGRQKFVLFRGIFWIVYFYFYWEEKIHFWNFKRKVNRILNKARKITADSPIINSVIPKNLN